MALEPMALRDATMWSMAVSEFADIKALLNVVLAVQKFQLLRLGVPDQEIDQTIAKWTEQYRADAQQYSKTLLAMALPKDAG